MKRHNHHSAANRMAAGGEEMLPARVAGKGASVANDENDIAGVVSVGSAQMAWEGLIPEEQWIVYGIAIEAVQSSGIEFLIGGAFGLAAYTQRLRNTKDLDLFVLPHDRDTTIRALSDAGFADYFPRLPYDRGWIYRSVRDETIVDVIWGMPNRRCQVDSIWFDHAKPIQVRGRSLRVIPAEELLWVKLYVLQRDRCDWPDVFNLLDAAGPTLDWRRILDRLADDTPLLRAALSVYGWLCPGAARDLAPQIFTWLQLPPPDAGKVPRCDEWRINLLDTRPWFAAMQPADEPMKL